MLPKWNIRQRRKEASQELSIIIDKWLIQQQFGTEQSHCCFSNSTVLKDLFLVNITQLLRFTTTRDQSSSTPTKLWKSDYWSDEWRRNSYTTFVWRKSAKRHFAGSIAEERPAEGTFDPVINRLKCDSSTSYPNGCCLEVFWDNTSVRNATVSLIFISSLSISSQNLVSGIYSSTAERMAWKLQMSMKNLSSHTVFFSW